MYHLDNGFGAEGAKAATDYLKTNPSCVSLVLASNLT